ncbi:MAG: NAD-dependent epimerase/dehydratase family protein [Verrucomicrobiota bacterium]
MKRVLVTGGRGGIGRSITDALRVLSNFRVITLGRSDVPNAKEPDDTIHLQGSVLDEVFLKELLEQHLVTHIIHAAGARTSECAADPLTGFEANVLGTDRVFRAARKCDSIEQVVHFSSAAIYGSHTERPDEAAPISPSSPYAVSKAAAEMSATGHSRAASFSTVILRPAFVLGPHSTGTLSAFIQRAVEGFRTKLTFPEQFFIHWAPDLAEMLITLLEAEQESKLEILHPPGTIIKLSDLVSILEQQCYELGLEPSFEVYAEKNSPFPAQLDCTKWMQTNGGVTPTQLSEVLRHLSKPAALPDRQTS